MFEDSSAKYYEDNKEILQKKTRERYQTLFTEEKKKKCDNMLVNDTKIYHKMKNKIWLSIEKNIIK